MMLRVSVALVSALASTLPSGAHAFAYANEPTQAEAPADPAEVEAAVGRATAAFDAGDFAGAVAAFEEAYALDPQPRFLFNIGRIHEEAGEIDLAIEHYRRFVRQPGVELEQRDRASQRIEVLSRIKSTMSDTPPPRPVTDAAPPTTDVPPPDDDPRRPGRGIRNAGIALLGVGAGLLLGGVVTGLLAQRTSNDLDDEDEPARRRDLVDRGEGLAVGTDVLIGVGAALAVTGTVLTAVGAVRMRGASRGRVSASVGPRSFGIGYAARF
jgi:tetratricopeptide (TPR) repeat protein